MRSETRAYYGLLLAILVAPLAVWAGPVSIVLPGDASDLESFSGRELRRYLYVRTSELVPITTGAAAETIKGDRIIIGRKDRDTVTKAVGAELSSTITQLKPQEYVLKTLSSDGIKTLIVAGGDDTGTLYGAYRLAEHLGVRFYMEGDVVPDERMALQLPDVDDRGSPLFELRGIQPFHDFPEGPDWWDLDMYQAVISQLPKMRMNFIGFHTYPEGGVGPEPMTWIGTPEEVGSDGRVKVSYPSRHFSTISGTWGSQAKKTSEYFCGAATLFDEDNYCQEVQRGMVPWPDTPEKCNELFHRFGDKLKVAFEHARRLGVKTCIGTETPLIAPASVRARFKPRQLEVEAVGGSVVSYGSPIEGTDDDVLYQSVRYNLQAYRFTVPNGSYKVTLKFCEVAHEAPGIRVFSVNVQGKPAVEKLDIFAKVGKNRSQDYTVADAAVTDGKLAIDFVPIVELPSISAIVIEGPKTIKVNCGGPEYKDYVADDGQALLDTADTERLYAGIFTRIMRTHPLDYYWFWTPEGWTWSDVADKDVRATMADLKAAVTAAANVKASFQLATCGWVLGPQTNRALFDQELPKSMPVSCISRAVGHDVVEPAFAQVKGRGKWAIPWLEDDPALLSAQLWAGRMRKDAVDAKAYGCTGLMGIHWRTRIMGPNVAALAAAAWDQSHWAESVMHTQGADGGSVELFADKRIEGTKTPDLYRTQRTGLRTYCIPTTNGTRAVVLHFCELVHAEKGKRVFTVKVQGQPVLQNFDVFAEAGQGKALVRRIEGVRVTDGWVVIEFVPQTGEPCIAAVEDHTPLGPPQRFNCGGPTCADFFADLKPVRTAGRYMAVTDFYCDWARQSFGSRVADKAGELFARIDGNLPRPSNWVDGPGGLFPDGRSPAEIAKDYAFIAEMEALRPMVKGAGNLERFDFWLDTFRHLHATAVVDSLLAEQNKGLDALRKATDEAVKRKIAREQLLPIRVRLARAVEQVYVHLLSTVTNASELGTIANWEQHNLPGLLTKPGEELAKALGEPPPSDAMPSREYAGKPRLIVPAVRTSVDRGEALKLKLIILDGEKVRPAPVLYWRPMGKGEFQTVSATHKARGVYEVAFPTAATSDDLEYYVQADLPTGKLQYPVTAPTLNQTVIVTKPG